MMMIGIGLVAYEESRPLKAVIGKRARSRDDGFAVTLAHRRDIDRQRNAASLNGNLDSATTRATAADNQYSKQSAPFANLFGALARQPARRFAPSRSTAARPSPITPCSACRARSFRHAQSGLPGISISTFMRKPIFHSLIEPLAIASSDPANVPQGFDQ